MTRGANGAGAPVAKSARESALEVVTQCLAGEFLAPSLRKVLDASGLQGAERSLVTDLSYGTVRRLPQLDAALAPFLKSPAKLPARVLIALRIAAYELLFKGTPSYAAVSAWVEVVKGETPALTSLANAVLRSLTRQEAEPSSGDEGAGAEAAVDPERDLALPAWLYQSFVASLGEDTARRAALGMLEPEPLWLTAFSPRAEAALRAQDCEVLAGPTTVEGGLQSLRVRSPLPLDRLLAFREGLVQPQNPSSLYAAQLLVAEQGELVFDLASGQGVKTAVLAAAGARVIAVERSSRRNRAARANLRRLGLGVQHVVADLVSASPDELLAHAEGPVAKVMLDAPCSGTGTLRGHPEIKLRLSQEDVSSLARTQAAMLDTAAQLVAPGGSLLYAVCSLTPEEGPQQAASFLERDARFAYCDFLPALPNIASDAGRFVLPVDGLDGFFLSLLERAD